MSCIGTGTGSAGASNALNIYDRHFLFGAENIDAVRTLVQDALRAHALATLRPRVDHDTFGRAANHLVDNQAICGPSRILTLVREAIAAGKIEARVVPAPDPRAPGAAVETGAETAQSDRVDVSVRVPP